MKSADPMSWLKNSIAISIGIAICATFAGCSTVDTRSPEQRLTDAQKRYDTINKEFSVQALHPTVMAGACINVVPEDGKCYTWGPLPFALVSKERIMLVASDMSGSLRSLAHPYVILGQIDAKSIRGVGRGKTVDGYQTVLLNYDDDVQYYVAPFEACELSPFGQIKRVVQVQGEAMARNAESADYLYTVFQDLVTPRPADAGPMLKDKSPNQFLNEESKVEGVLSDGENAVEIHGVHMILNANIKGRELSIVTKDYKPGLFTMPAQKYPLRHGLFGFAIDTNMFTVLTVRLPDESWRYRVEYFAPPQ